ncbi:MAG: (Fe-S)-binding protein [Promethearchaeota archaeon]|nr:MAG: (Fe-S)-binding protein [Candidatus Lokiarchaeota archaeon]
MTEVKKEPDLKLNKKLVEDSTTLSLRSLLKKCYQCARCSGVCQLSKVQKFTPSRIIQRILEGFEDEVLESGVLWDCLMCNSCLQKCPEDINFADIVRVARHKMVQTYEFEPDNYTAHKGVYLSISELMSKPKVQPKRNLDWIPKECKIAEKGDILYHVGCLPYFKFEFEGLDPIAINTVELLCKTESDPIVVLKDEYCCGHDVYWGRGNLEAFLRLAEKNIQNFERSGIKTIITTCSEGYRTFKIDYPKYFKDFEERFEVKHIIEYIYEKWKEGIIEFEASKKIKEDIRYSFHDPCRMSRFLPKENDIMEKVREIFYHLNKSGPQFNEMPHNRENSLCCGIGSWIGCNERSKALRYKRLLEAKKVGQMMVTSCPKCIMHFRCLQNDYEDIADLDILDFTEFIMNFVKVTTKEG